MTRRKNALIVPIAPLPIRRSYVTAVRAYERYAAYVEETSGAFVAPGLAERYERDPNLAEAASVGQAAYCVFARWQSSYHAWLRGAAWATGERLEADAEAFAEFVDRECKPLARVIPLRPDLVRG